MANTNKLIIQNVSIRFMKVEREDYVWITDIA